MTRLSISLLGPLHITLDGEPVADFGTEKVRALLAYLAVEVNIPHRRDALAGLLWPDQPQQKARHSLRQALSHLRASLCDSGSSVPFLLVSRETVQFNPDSDHWLDVEEFADLTRACKSHHHRHLDTCIPCVRRLERMVELYRGEFLEHFFLSDSDVFEEWALLKREWFHCEAVDALYHLANAYERRGDYARARQIVRQHVALEPWREEAHRQLMRLLALDGQRSAALVQYETCRRALIEELGVEPTSETVALYEQIRNGGDLRPQAHFQRLPPSPNPFVGREGEIAELVELLSRPGCRLVTLVGPGGIGKTRLALQIAKSQIGAFLHGVAFVPLASVNSDEELVNVIADALAIPLGGDQDPKAQLCDYVRAREMLLVLDGMEHVMNGSTLLSEILLQAPHTVFLVTSRERLNLREEWIYEVDGLTYPEDDQDWREESHSAIELFLQRARQADQHFTIDARSPDVAHICRLVEGMPLGIELAAAWVSVRPCAEIAREIENNLDILTARLRNVPERHRSIRAAFEHSWQLLTDAEKRLLARLSVFRGGFRREAAAEVAGASSVTLAALLDKSLIRHDSADRYGMHELLRQYAAEKLHATPQEEEDTKWHHAHYFAALLAQQEPHLRGSSQGQALLTIGQEFENTRWAWRWAVARGGVDEVERSMESLYHFTDIRCLFQEGIDLLAQAIDQWHEGQAQAHLAGKALSRQGALYRHLGRYRQARECLEQGLTISEHLRNKSEQIFCLHHLAEIDRSQSRYEEAEKLARRCLVLSRQAEYHHGIASSLLVLGLVRYRTGDVDQAEPLLEESLTISRKTGDRRLTMCALNGLGDVNCHQGEYAKGKRAFEECLALSRELGDQYNVAIHLNNLGTVLHVLEEYTEARPFYEESLEICRGIGDRAGQAIALSNLGEVAYALGEHLEAQEFYREGLAIGRDIQHQWTVMACLNNLGEIACALEDYETARSHLAEAVKLTAETQTLSVLLKVLNNLAVLLAREGQQETAAALLGLAHCHPASEQATQDKAERLLNEMELVPPQRAPEDLEAVVAEVLAEICAGDP